MSNSQRKHIVRWLRSRQKGYLLDAPSPWISFDAIDYLKRWLKQDIHVFEYGSGGSTLFWLLFNAECVSIEHDTQWFSVIHQRLGTSSAVDYRLVPPEKMSENMIPMNMKTIADPHCYLSSDAIFEGYSFRNYVSQIDNFPDNYFDLVMIDGRARPSCLMHSVRKVKRDGLLILDNAERNYYTEQTHPFLQNFTKIEFWGVGPLNDYFTRTDFYKRVR